MARIEYYEVEKEKLAATYNPRGWGLIPPSQRPMDTSGPGWWGIGMVVITVIVLIFLPGCSAAPAQAQTYATPTIYNTPKPAIDYQPTIAALQTISASDRQSALESRERVAAAVETANAANVEAVRITATIGAESRAFALEQMSAKATNDNRLIVATETAVNLEIEKSRAQADLIETKRRAETQGVTNIVESLFVVGIMFLAFAFFLWALQSFRAQSAALKQAREEAEPEQEPVKPLGRFIDGLSLTVFDDVIDIEKLSAIAHDIMNGGRFSHSWQVLTQGNCTETEFTKTQAVFVRYGLAEWRDPIAHNVGCKLTGKGRFFLSVLAESTPPPERKAQETSEITVNDTIEGGFTPYNGGGGGL